MTDEQDLEPIEIDESIVLQPEDDALGLMEDTLDSLLAVASVDSVYGDPVEKDENMIIPAAEVVAGMGFGLGAGSGGDAEDAGGSGVGGGGGGRSFARPVAVIIASPQGVRVEPVIDLTKIALAALTAGAFMLTTLARLRNPGKNLKELQEGNWD
ncbi:MAG: spore germination protein GerW family protein [Chloroflexota bacterium]